MINKLKLIVTTAAFLTSSVVFAQEQSNNESAKQENFAARKSQIISNLNKEKSIIDSSISCVNATQNMEAIKACHDQRRSAMDTLKNEMVQNRKENLQKRIGKINERIQKMDQKTAEKSSEN